MNQIPKFLVSLIFVSFFSLQFFDVAAAQDINPLNLPEAFAFSPECQTADALINNITALPILGGGVLSNNIPVSGQITASDAGDRWVLAAKQQSPVRLDFSQITLNLQVVVYQGVRQIFNQTLAQGGASLNLPIDVSGYYTLVISRTPIHDASLTGSYSLVATNLALPIDDAQRITGTVEGTQDFIFFADPGGTSLLEISNFSDPNIQISLQWRGGNLALAQEGTSLLGRGYYALSLSGTGNYDFEIDSITTGNRPLIKIDPLYQPNWTLAPQVLSINPNSGLLEFVSSTGVVLNFYADSLHSITDDRNISLRFLDLSGQTGEQQVKGRLLFPAQGATEVRYLEHNLDVSVISNGTPSGFLRLTEYLPNEQENIEISNFFSNFELADRQISGLEWSYLQSVFLLDNCLAFIYDDGRQVIAQGNDHRLSFPSFDSLNAAHRGASAGYSITITWQDIEKLIFDQGLIAMNRRGAPKLTLMFDRLNVTVAPEGAFFTIRDENAPSNLLLKTDWKNLIRMHLIANTLKMQVNDERQVIVLNQKGLVALEAIEDALRLVWQDGSQSLMLGLQEDFIQIETPSSLMPYDGSSPTRLPANFDNTGNECYVIQTILDFACVAEGEIVNPANGNLHFSVTDLYLSGYRLDLFLGRSYNSQSNDQDGPLGYGWTTNYLLDYASTYGADPNSPKARLINEQTDYLLALDLREAPLGRVRFQTPSGSSHLFNFNRQAAQWQSNSLANWQLETRADPLLSPWRLLGPDGTILEFDRAGRLRMLRHAQGGQLSIQRENPRSAKLPAPQDGSPFSLTDTYRISDHLGRSLVLIFDANQHLSRSELRDEDNNVLYATEYELENSLLLGVKHLSATGEILSESRYTYTETKLLSAFQNDVRAPITSTLYFAYEGDRVCAISHQDLAGNCLVSADSLLYRSYRYENETSFVIDEWNRQESYQYLRADDIGTNYRLIQHTDALGQANRYSYDPNRSDYQISNLSRNNITHPLRYDSPGNLSSLGNSEANATLFEFEASYQTYRVPELNMALPYVQSFSQAEQNDIRQYVLDETGRILEVIIDGKLAYCFSNYSPPPFNLPQTIRIQDLSSGGTCQTPSSWPDIILSYNNHGYLSSRLDEQGQHCFIWDAWGRLKEYQHLAAGQPCFDESLAQNSLRHYEIQYQETSSGAQMLIRDVLLQTETELGYDQRRQLISRQVRAGTDILSNHRYSYDIWGNLETHIEYSNPEATEGLVIQYEYLPSENGFWELRQTHTGLNGGPSQSQIFQYDAADRLSQQSDSFGNQNRYTYDFLGEIDDFGQLLTRENNGITQRYRFNSHGQLNQVQFADGPIWTVEYIDQGQQGISTISLPSDFVGASNRPLILSYSSTGFQTPTRQEVSYNILDPEGTPQGQTWSKSQEDLNFAYQYDGFGRAKAIQNGDQILTWDYRYENGLLVVEERFTQSEASLMRLYRYDGLGRIISIESNLNGIVEKINYQYRPIQEQHQWQVEVSFEDNPEQVPSSWVLSYDAEGNLRSWLDEYGIRHLYTYDLHSRLLSVQSVSATAALEDGGPTDYEYVYNHLDQVTYLRSPDEEIIYTYNDLGQLISTLDSRGVSYSYLYDSRGRIKSIIDSLGFSVSYQLNDAGQLVRYTDQLGRELTFDWNLAQRGLFSYRSANNTAEFYFDLVGRLWQVNSSTGNLFLDYDSQGRLLQVQADEGLAPLSLRYDEQAQLVGLSRLNSPWEWTFAYDWLGYLSQRLDPNGAVLAAGYDLTGRLSEISTGEFARVYTYNGQSVIIDSTWEDVLYHSRSLTFDTAYRLIEQSQRSGEAAEAKSFYQYGDNTYIAYYPDNSCVEYTIADSINESAYIRVQVYDGCLVGTNPATMQASLSRNYYFDVRGQLTSMEQEWFLPVKDAAGSQVQPYRQREFIVYDGLGRPIRYQDAANNLYVYTYDEQGNLSNIQLPNGSVYQYAYDAANRLSVLTLPNGKNLSITYDLSSGSQRMVLSLEGELIEAYGYDNLGNLISRSFELAQGQASINYQYDAMGLPIGWSSEGGDVQWQRGSNALHLPECLEDGFANRFNTYTYRPGLALQDWTQGTGVCNSSVPTQQGRYTYDSTNQLQSIEQGGQLFTYTLLEEGGKKYYTLNFSGEQAITFERNPYGQLDRVQVGQAAMDIEYQTESLPDTLEAVLRWPNTMLTLRFNRTNDLNLITFADSENENYKRYRYNLNYAGLPFNARDNLLDITWGYDSLNRVVNTIWRFNDLSLQAGKLEYSFSVDYDILGRPQNETSNLQSGPQIEHSYHYEAESPWLLRERRRTQIPDQANRAPFLLVFIFPLSLLALKRAKRPFVALLLGVLIFGSFQATLSQDMAANSSYSYDALGNLESLSNVQGQTRFAYDGFNRLLNIQSPQSQTTLEYNPFGQLSRLIRQDNTGSNTEVEFIYDGSNLRFLRQNGQVYALYSPLPDHYLIVAQMESWDLSLFDAFGIPRDYYRSNATPQWENLQVDARGRFVSTQLMDQGPWYLPVFRGMLYDVDSQIYIGLDGLAYDPTSGNYLQRDFLGPDAHGNLYVYHASRAEVPLQSASAITYETSLDILSEFSRQSQHLNPESLKQDHMPHVFEPRLGISSFDQHVQARFLQLNNLGQAITHTINPMGVSVSEAGYFQLADVRDYSWQSLGAGGGNLGELSPRWPQTFATPQWQIGHTQSLISQGQVQIPSWQYRIFSNANDQYFQWPQQAPTLNQTAQIQFLAETLQTDLMQLPYFELFDHLGNLPTQEGWAWIELQEEEHLPAFSPPDVPDDLNSWLKNWFTNDTLGLWQEIEAQRQLPVSPSFEIQPEWLNLQP